MDDIFDANFHNIANQLNQDARQILTGATGQDVPPECVNCLSEKIDDEFRALVTKLEEIVRTAQFFRSLYVGEKIVEFTPRDGDSFIRFIQRELVTDPLITRFYIGLKYENRPFSDGLNYVLGGGSPRHTATYGRLAIGKAVFQRNFESGQVSERDVIAAFDGNERKLNRRPGLPFKDGQWIYCIFYK